VPTIIVEKNARPGDSWRKRYKSLCLHDPVWYDHLPYIAFPKNWPVFSPKDKIGDWLEMYAKVMELNYWGSDECQTRELRRREEGMDRRRRARRQADHAAAEAAGVRDRHVGQAQHAEIQGHGDGSRASSTIPQASRPRRLCKGKKVVVIGSNNSAHDICAALWESGADVTMVQRSSSTHRRALRHADGIGLGDLYSERAVRPA
jgi:putative flavoprotein involved in K+ transport